MKRLDPKIFPKTISGFFNLAAAIVPATSGRLVPSATTVTPITIDEISKSSASFIALFTTKELPYIVAPRDSSALGHTLETVSSMYYSSSNASSLTNLYVIALTSTNNVIPRINGNSLINI